MAKLISNSYGKHRVRVLKVHRDSETHHRVCELEVDVLLSGDLDGSYLSDDNSSIVPTDTCKNTVQFLAHDFLGTCRTDFADTIGRHFLSKYAHINGVDVEIRERSWKAMQIDGKSHPHAFTHEANGLPFTTASFSRDGEPVIRGGIREHLVMKTTGSGFAGYNRCELTTLPETADRILSSRVSAEWTFEKGTAGFSGVDGRFLEVLHRVFAETYSPSVQRTLFEVGEAALAEIGEISEITLTMPNVHFLGLDLSKLGRPDQTSVFLPTDEPHGQITARIGREG